MISFAPLNYGIIILLLASKPSHSQDTDFPKIEENLINTMRDIRMEVISLQTDLKQVKNSVDTLEAKSDLLMKNQNAVQSKSEKALLELKEKLIEDISEATKIISLEISLNKDFIMNSQYAVQYKLEKGLFYLEERLIENFSETARNISLDVSSCKESNNVNGSLTNLVLEKISSKSEDNKEILNKKEMPPLPFGNETHSNGTGNFGTNKTVLPKSMEGHKYFSTDYTHGDKVASYCDNHDGKPFIPKTKDEFIFYIAMINRHLGYYSWYPLNDIEEEGHVVHLDGTDYETSIFKVEKWDTDPDGMNTDDNDCVRVNIKGEGSWVNCEYYYYYRSICQRN